jgi:GntR family transcriptional regulator
VAGVVDPSPAASALEDRPRYYRVYRALAEDIAEGRLGPGDRLPVERALCERFGVSRATIRRAARELERDGLVESSARRGAFVSSGPLSEPPNVLLSFAAMAAARGLMATANVLGRSVRPASIDEAESLQIAPGSEIFHLERLRMLDGIPVSVDDNRVALARAPAVVDADYERDSLYRTLETRCGVTPTRGEYTIEAVAADPGIAELLGVTSGAPLLLTNDRTFDQAGRPISLSRIIYRGDRYRFRANVHRRAV